MPCGARRVGRGRSTGMLSMVSRAILKSLRLAPSTATPTGTPDASAMTLRLVPLLARSVGLGPVFFPPERRLGDGSVHGHPVPVDADELVIVQEAPAPEFLEDARLGPLHEPAVRRGVLADPGPVE